MQVPYSAKVILCGEYGAGKSSLFRRFSTDSFTTKTGPSSTIGLDHFSKKYEFPPGDSVALDLWDTGGMERVATITSNYYKHTAAAILVCDKVNRSTLSSLPHHLLEVVVHAPPGVKIFLCLTKDDLKSNDGPEDEISKDDLREFCLQVGNEPGIEETFFTSSKTGQGVSQMFASVAASLHDARLVKRSPTTTSLTLRDADLRQASKVDNNCC